MRYHCYSGVCFTCSWMMDAGCEHTKAGRCSWDEQAPCTIQMISRVGADGALDRRVLSRLDDKACLGGSLSGVAVRS